MKSQGGPTSNINLDELAKTKSILNSSPDGKTFNNATYKLGGKVNPLPGGAAAKDNDENVESPRDKRYQPKNEYNFYNE